MYDQPIIVASPQHLAIRLMVVRMRANQRIESSLHLERAKATLIAGMDRWCAEHRVTLEWSDTPGRRSKNKEYRIAYQGDNSEAADPSQLFDALDAEMLRLILN